MSFGEKSLLLVGEQFRAAPVMAERLQDWGFVCQIVPTLEAARKALRSEPVDVVLSQERLPDGTGFQLVSALSGLPVTAYVCVSLEDGFLWLPALEGGRDCWGKPAIRPSALAHALQAISRQQVAPLASAG